MSYSNHPAVLAMANKERPTPGENQAVCPRCDGLGMELENRHAYMCRRCYGAGLVHRCKHCGKSCKALREPCSCPLGMADRAAENSRKRAEREARDVERWQRHPATHINDWTGPAYSDAHDQYFSSAIVAWERFDENTPEQMRLYGCRVIQRRLDAETILGDYCEGANLDEAAIENNMEGVDSLQAVLDAWCAENPAEHWDPDYSQPLTFDLEATNGD